MIDRQAKPKSKCDHEDLVRQSRNQNSEHLAQRRKALSFRPLRSAQGKLREKSFSDPSHSLGMTDLGPSILRSWRRGRPSVASGEPEDFLNVADNLGAELLGCFENDARLVLVTGNVVAFKQDPFDGMINSRRLVDGLTGGRLAGDLTPQSLIVSRSDFNEYIHVITSLWLRGVNSLNGSKRSMGSNRAPRSFQALWQESN